MSTSHGQDAPTHLRRVLTVVDSRESLDWLWERVHPKLRDRLRALMPRDRDVFQPTAILGEVFRIQAERPRRDDPKPPIPRRLATGPFKFAKIDLDAFMRGELPMTHEQVTAIFQAIVVNDARSFLSDIGDGLERRSHLFVEFDTRLANAAGARSHDLAGFLDRLANADGLTYRVLFCSFALDMSAQEIAAVEGVGVEVVERELNVGLKLLRYDAATEKSRA